MIKMKGNTAGFTLIELMVVLGIIALIATVAIPSYQDSTSKARRSDAQAALLSFSGAMERHYTANNTYTGAATAGDTGSPDVFSTEAPIDGDVKYYDLTIHSASATAYELRATPKGAQAGDGFLSINSLGVRSWDRNNNGSSGDSGENSWGY